jgi:hypothetical protein
MQLRLAEPFTLGQKRGMDGEVHTFFFNMIACLWSPKKLTAKKICHVTNAQDSSKCCFECAASLIGSIF